MTHVNFTTSGVTLTDPQVARIREEIENTRFRSAWDNGVKLYALDILGDYSKMLDYAKETGGYTPRFIETTFTRAGTKSGVATASGYGADSMQGISPRMTADITIISN